MNCIFCDRKSRGIQCAKCRDNPRRAAVQLLARVGVEELALRESGRYTAPGSYVFALRKLHQDIVLAKDAAKKGEK